MGDNVEGPVKNSWIKEGREIVRNKGCFRENICIIVRENNAIHFLRKAPSSA